MIGDAGLPVPPGVRVIDLAVTRGVPGFLEVLDAVVAEMCVERAVIASEAGTIAADSAARLPVERETHSEFKRLSAGARAIVRTGECTPYANVALFAGVVF